MLLGKTLSVLKLYYSLPVNMRAAMLPPIIKMGEGMSDFSQKQTEGITQLKSESELELYCYYVAGTVGEMLTALFQEHLGKNTHASVLEKHKIDFGLGLQLTNILKDYADDSKRNWCYIPETLLQSHNLDAKTFFSKTYPERNRQVLSVLIAKTGHYLQNALEYTLAIPRTAFRLRWFCALPLFLAVDTLVLLKHGLTNMEPNHKLTRSQVKRMVMVIPWVSFSDAALRKCFRDRLAPVFEIGTV
jgi:farnesyl-diphosphate farnesyltransferase